MEQRQDLLLRLLSAALGGPELSAEYRRSLSSVRPDVWKDVMDEAVAQGTASMLYDVLSGLGCVPEETLRCAEFNMETAAASVWRLIPAVHIVADAFAREKIGWVVLKGLGLCALYPKDSMRRAGDLDLLVTDASRFDDACSLLLCAGFREAESHGGHHREFRIQVGSAPVIVEMHSRAADDLRSARANEALRRITAECLAHPSEVSLPGVTVPVPEPTEYAFFLLVHMLQHWLLAGFGLRLLCDWTVFLRRRGADIDFDRFLSLCGQIGAAGFARAVTCACVSRLGLDAGLCSWASGSGGAAAHLLDDVLKSGEFGRRDRSRVLAAEKSGVFGLFRAFHREALRAFPRAGKMPLFWPYLWAAALYRFIRNNKNLRRTSLGRVLKSASGRSALFRELGIFQWPD